MAGGLVAEGVHRGIEVEVVVDGLGHVGHPDAPGRLLRHLHGREGGVVTADGDELGDPQAGERIDHGLEKLVALGRVGARGAEIGAAAEVDAADVFQVERPDVLGAAVHEPVEAVANPQHLHSLKERPDGRGADHAVDPGGGPAAHQYG
jgi:hypothetical protein